MPIVEEEAEMVDSLPPVPFRIDRDALAEVIKAAWQEWDRARWDHGDVVPEKSAPVLWFGNLSRYETSERRIVTIRVNPGPDTFPVPPEEDPWLYYPSLNGARARAPDVYEAAMAEFPLHERYPSWWKGLLEPQGAHFTPNCQPTNTPLHLDLSTITTNPRFSKERVGEAARQVMLTNGIEILWRLLAILRPHVTFLSVKADYYNLFSAAFEIRDAIPWTLGVHEGCRAVSDRTGEFLWLRHTTNSAVSAGYADQYALGSWMLQPRNTPPPHRSRAAKEDRMTPAQMPHNPENGPVEELAIVAALEEVVSLSNGRFTQLARPAHGSLHDFLPTAWLRGDRQHLHDQVLTFWFQRRGGGRVRLNALVRRRANEPRTEQLVKCLQARLWCKSVADTTEGWTFWQADAAGDDDAGTAVEQLVNELMAILPDVEACLARTGLLGGNG
ncbi:MAG: hypothetical protein ACOYOB_17545 [Myxococcota bacterium]